LLVFLIGRTVQEGLFINLKIFGFKPQDFGHSQKKIPILFRMGIKYIAWERHFGVQLIFLNRMQAL
jgi:hypothetical protein